MSLGTGALKVGGKRPKVIQAPQGGLHGNLASGNHPRVAATNRHRHTETSPVEILT